MKKNLVISMTICMLLAFGGTAYAQSTCQSTNQGSCNQSFGCYNICWQNSCNNSYNSSFWQQFFDKWGWQQGEDETPETPTTPEIPETPDSDSNNDNNSSNENSDSSSNNTNLSYAEQVVALVNQEREAAGLSPVTLDETVSAAALVRAKEAAQSFSHTRPNGSSCFTALKEAGVSYRGAGENIAYGQSTPSEVMNAWLNSSGHRANIMNSKYTTIGVGYTVINGTAYWAQFFTY